MNREQRMAHMTRNIKIYPGRYGEQSRRNIFLPNLLVTQLKSMANLREITYSELIRQILVEHVAVLKRG